MTVPSTSSNTHLLHTLSDWQVRNLRWSRVLRCSVTLLIVLSSSAVSRPRTLGYVHTAHIRLYVHTWPICRLNSTNPIFSHPTLATFVCGLRSDMYPIFCNATLAWTVRSHFSRLLCHSKATDLTILWRRRRDEFPRTNTGCCVWRHTAVWWQPR